VSKGFRPTTTLGVRRLRFCKDCGRKFTPQNQKPLEAKDKKAGGSEPRQVSDSKPVSVPQSPVETPDTVAESAAVPQANKDIMPSNEPSA